MKHAVIDPLQCSRRGIACDVVLLEIGVPFENGGHHRVVFLSLQRACGVDADLVRECQGGGEQIVLKCRELPDRLHVDAPLDLRTLPDRSRGAAWRVDQDRSK